MRSLILTALTLALSAAAAQAMPGATVGIPLGAPDPFGTMRREAAPPVAEAGPDETVRHIERRPRTPRPSRPRAPSMRR